MNTGSALAMLLFWPRHRLGHHENYLFSLSKKIFTRSKYPKVILFNFENRSTVHWSTLLISLYHLVDLLTTILTIMNTGPVPIVSIPGASGAFVLFVPNYPQCLSRLMYSLPLRVGPHQQKRPVVVSIAFVLANILVRSPGKSFILITETNI